MDLVHFPSADATKCDKGYDTANGCLAHGMKRYYGGIIAEPQGVTIKDNSTGVFGFGRSTITSVSLVADSIYDQVVPEIYTDAEMPVNCKVAAGRDESDFYEALGIVGEGPLIAYTDAHYEDLNGNPVGANATGAVFVGSTLDGQAQHGWPNQPTFGLRQCLGTDPAGATDFFSLDQIRQQHWRGLAQSRLRNLGVQGQLRGRDRVPRDPAQSTPRACNSPKPGDHAMIAYVQQGMSGWVWTSLGVRTYGPALTNPVWIAVNMLLRARGLRLGGAATTAQLDLAETFFDVQAALDAAAICNDQVTDAGRLRQRDAVQVPRRAAGREAAPRLAPGSADELPGLLHVRIRQAQDRHPRELLDGGGLHHRQHPVQLAPVGADQAVVQSPDGQLRGPGLQVRQQLGHRLRHRLRHADRQRRRPRCS